MQERELIAPYEAILEKFIPMGDPLAKLEISNRATDCERFKRMWLVVRAEMNKFVEYVDKEVRADVSKKRKSGKKIVSE